MTRLIAAAVTALLFCYSPTVRSAPVATFQADSIFFGFNAAGEGVYSDLGFNTGTLDDGTQAEVDFFVRFTSTGKVTGAGISILGDPLTALAGQDFLSGASLREGGIKNDRFELVFDNLTGSLPQNQFTIATVVLSPDTTLFPITAITAGIGQTWDIPVRGSVSLSQLSVLPAPLPAPVLLLLSGIAMLGGLRWRARRSALAG